jgi:hypothetical protein
MSIELAVCLGAWGGLLAAAALIALIQWDTRRQARRNVSGDNRRS